MHKNSHGISWVCSLFFLGLISGLAGTAPRLSAADKSKTDPAAEAKQAQQEDEQDNDPVERKKRQRMFFGTFLLPSDPSQQTSSDVVGTFVTDERDRKPGRTYLVKVENGKKDVLAALKRYDIKKVQVGGKLRNIGPDGEAKYLIVSGVIETSATPPVKDHRIPAAP